MALDISTFTGALMGWATNLLFWALLIIAIAGSFLIFLLVRRNMRYKYPCIEIVGLGEGKVSVYNTKAGWFKKKKILFGLLDNAGEQELLCKDGHRKIFSASSIDYHEINGKRGIICKRKDDDPDVLVPLNRVEVDGLKLLVRIAPADYRDAAVDILKEKQRETMGWLEKNAPMIIAMGIFIFGLVALIIVFNFAKQESEAWRAFAEGARVVQTVVSPTAP